METKRRSLSDQFMDGYNGGATRARSPTKDIKKLIRLSVEDFRENLGCKIILWGISFLPDNKIQHDIIAAHYHALKRHLPTTEPE